MDDPESKPPEVERDEKGRIKPGASGNPGGKPKKLVEFQKALHDRFYEKSLTVMEDLLDDPSGKIRVAALRELYDRMFGKPTQAITGEDGKPISLDFDLLGVLRKFVEK